MYQQMYYVDKTTGTFADVLIAYGLATILGRMLPEDAAPEIRLSDDGHCYRVTLAEPVQPQWVAQASYFANVPFILTDKLKQKGGYPKDLLLLEDYETHKQHNSQYFELRKQLPPEARRPGATVDQYPQLATVENLKPAPDWNIWAQVNQMSALSAYNGMVEAWHEARCCFAEHLQLILQMFAVTPNPVNESLQAWKKLAKAHNLSGKAEAAATQVYNPASGKGANRTKADSLTIGGQKNFWLVEYLKLVGMPKAGLPRIVSQAKDRKTYVLIPKDIKLNTSNRVFQLFQNIFWGSSAVKMDIFAALNFTRTFLEQWQAGQLDEVDRLLDMQPDGYIQGLAMVYYKDMGSALAVLNQSIINLPHWVERVTTKEEAQQFIDIINEHLAVIQTLNEDRGPEYALLATYRAFLSGGDLKEFFDFAASFSSFVTNKIEKKDYVNLFTTTNLEVLVTTKEKKLTPILQNSGFQNVAHAIRQATVNAQWAKVHNQRLYDIHYGLGQELKRKANYSDEFIQALSDFMQSYNQENVQMAERYKGNPPRRRTPLTTNDIAEVVALIDEYDSKTVGNLLIAFGYASRPKTEDSAETQDNQIN
jgi:hypothetical protein